MSWLRSKTILIGLLATWAALIAYLFATHRTPRHAPKVYVSGKPAPRSGDPAFREKNDLTLRLDLLREPPPQAREAKKNIFSPIQVFIPKLPPQSPTNTPAPTPTPTDQERAEAAATAEMANYKFIGYLDRQGKATAVIARGQDIYTVQKGKTVFGSIVLKDVKPDAAVIMDSNTKLESSLPLTNR